MVPMLLVNEATPGAEVEKLEMRHLANKEANLLFSLLTALWSKRYRGAGKRLSRSWQQSEAKPYLGGLLPLPGEGWGAVPLGYLILLIFRRGIFKSPSILIFAPLFLLDGTDSINGNSASTSSS